MVAIDVNNNPYYGQPTPDVVGGPKKQGTKWFFSYATAVLLHKHRRYTIALEPLPPHTKPHEIVRVLLDQIAEKGLKIRGVTLDSAFDSGDTILLLQERKLAYSIPLRRKGEGRNARNQCFEGRNGLVRWIEWTTKASRHQVRTRTLLWKGKVKTMVFAFQGWSGDRARNVHQQAQRFRQLYRRRFGIETSYRQKNQGQDLDDEPGPGLPAVAGGHRVFAAPSLGGADGRTRPPFESAAQRLDRRPDGPHDGRLARSRTDAPPSRNPSNHRRNSEFSNVKAAETTVTRRVGVNPIRVGYKYSRHPASSWPGSV